MSKERLEEIRDKYSKANIIEHLYGKDIIAVDKKDMDYITEESIEQAERVQELEKIKDAKIALVNKGDEEKRYVEQERMIELERQNKRYRETLWDINIKLRDLFVEVWDMDNGELQGEFYKMSKIIQNELEESE